MILVIAFVIFTSSFIGCTLLFCKPTWQFITVYMMIALSLSFFVLRFLREKYDWLYERMYQKQQIARLIESQGFQIKKNIEKKIKGYYPKVYYQIKEHYLHIRFPLDASQHQQKYLELQKQLEISLYAEMTDRINEKGYVLYEFMHHMESQRIGIQDVVMEQGRMRLMKNLWWEYDKIPHMLIAGGTGGGKTYFMLTLIQAILKSGGVLKICDPKQADLSDLKTLADKLVYDTIGGMMKTLRTFKEEMLAQTKIMKTMPKYRTGMNYALVGLPPHFLMMDEYVAFCEMADQERGEIEECIKQIAMLGRQAGFFLIVGCQRPDAKYFRDGIRDQFGFRVSLGKMYSSGYGMLFGDVDKIFIHKKIKGRGYADHGTGVISEFYAPYVQADYDFTLEIGRLLAERKQKPNAMGESRINGET